MVSPRLQAAAASTRRPEDVIAARVPREMPKGCPFCGTDPQPPYLNRFGKYSFGCENEECPIEPMASGNTAAEAMSKWNGRAA